MRYALPMIFAGLSLSGASAGAAEDKLPMDQVVQLPVAEDPTVSFRIWFQVGSQDDPPGKEGLAALTASMLTNASTQKNSYAQILDKLFPLAAGYSDVASTEMTVMYGRVHKDNLGDYYRLLSDAIRLPAFKQEDLDRVKSESLDYLQNTLRYASDEELGKAVLYNEIFAGTPYGHIPTGLIESVKSITLEDIRAFYRAHYTRENVVIGIGGGYDTTLFDIFRADMARLPTGKPAVVPPPRPAPIRGLRVTIVEKEAPATAISLGFPIDVVRGSKDWYALAVANSWLGEHRNSSSHLYQVIREQRGLNYGDYSYIEHFPHGGQLQVPPQNVARRRQVFEIWVRPVPNEARHFALRAALREFKHLVDHGMTEEEFNLTRTFLGKYVLHYAPTTMARLAYAVDDRFYGIQGSHLEKFRKAVQEVTLADVNAAIKKYWQYENVQIVLVTRDAEALGKALADDLPSPIHYPTPKSDAVLREDGRISRFPLPVKAQDVKIVPVADLFVK
jgi:zinc protease